MASQPGTESDAQLSEVCGEPTGPPGETLAVCLGITSDLSCDLKQVQFPVSLRVIPQSPREWALGAREGHFLVSPPS